MSVLDPLKRFANRFIIKRAVRRHQTAVLCIDIYAIYKCLLQGIFRLSDRHYLPATSNKNIQKLGNVCFAWLHFKTNITFTLNSTLFSPQKNYRNCSLSFYKTVVSYYKNLNQLKYLRSISLSIIFAQHIDNFIINFGRILGRAEVGRRAELFSKS